MKWAKSILTAGLIFIFIISPVYAGNVVTTYKVPDVKNAFCGVEINYQFCKCAFHDEYCGEVGMNPGSAHTYVLQEFREWNREKIQSTGQRCEDAGGYWNKSKWSCMVCTEGDALDGRRCVQPEKVDVEVQECKAALKDFDKNWEKYSDFDDRLGSDVSYEVRQFNKTLDEIGDLVARAHVLEYKLEIQREVRKEMELYKAALVLNIRQNITKAIFRLAWVTYNTVQGARGTRGSIDKILTTSSPTAALGATMKVIQAHIPASEKDLTFDTKKTEGKIKSAAWNATLEILESVADPTAVATQLAKDARSALVGGPDISEEEVAILRDQHLSNRAIDEAISDSYKESSLMRKERMFLERQITEKYNEMQQWKHKEYQRVKGGLEDQCKDKN